MRRDTMKAFRARTKAIESSIDAAIAEVQAMNRAEYAAARAAHAEREAARERFTRDDIVGALAIHDGRFWRRVVRVNKVTVSVATPYSWVDKIQFKDVHGVQMPLEGTG